jgi:hypothetical protein
MLLAAISWPAAAGAHTILVEVERPDGTPLPGAVVLLHGPRTGRESPATFVVDRVDQPSRRTHDHSDRLTVTFPNTDKVSHQVYSFSPASDSSCRSTAARHMRRQFDTAASSRWAAISTTT